MDEPVYIYRRAWLADECQVCIWICWEAVGLHTNRELTYRHPNRERQRRFLGQARGSALDVQESRQLGIKHGDFLVAQQ